MSVPEINRIQKATKQTHLSLILSGALDRSSKYEIRIRKNFNTACWSFRPPHYIFIGDKVLENVREGVAEDLDYYVGSYVHHEVGHSHYTERDLKSVDSFLRSKKLPFRMLNLFEDARIEHLMRLRTGRAFLWHKYEDLIKVDLTEPLGQYFFLIQNEYSHMDEVARNAFVAQNALDERIVDFYLQTLECVDTWEVVDVMVAWREVFPAPIDDTMQQLAGLGFDGESDLSESLQLQDNDRRLQQAIAQSSDINEGPETGSEDESCKGKGKNDPDGHGQPLEEFSSMDYYNSRPSVEIDERLIRRLLPQLTSIFKGRVVYTNTSRPSKRLSIKGIINDSDQIYRRKQERGKEAKVFNLLIDCSGSMSDEPLNGAAAIALLYSELARMGLVKGHIILSSTSGYQSFKMPMSREQIKGYFHTRGAEGFANTFEKTKNLMKKAEINFVITDGRIGDGELNKGKMAREGVNTFGIYVGDPEYCDLDSWFHRGVARHTLTEVVDELRRQILVKPL